MVIETMNTSESTKNIFEAMVNAQSKMPPVKMNKTNPFLKNKYADLGAIIETAQPILEEQGLAITQICTTKEGYVGVETVLIHKSGEWISSTMELPIGVEKGKSNSQVAGSIITYIRRYSLSAILGMYADEDGDGNNPPIDNTPPKQIDEGNIIPIDVIKDMKTPWDAYEKIESYATETKGKGSAVLDVLNKYVPDYDGDINDVDEEIVIDLVLELTGYKYDKGG